MDKVGSDFPSLYTVYDRVAEEAGPPFVAKNHGVARRAYAKLMSDCPQSLRGDYRLYCLSSWDPLKMVLVVYDKPELVDVEEVSDETKR